MAAESLTRLRDMPRESLEELALRAAIEVRNLRQQTSPNQFFIAVTYGFLLGAFVATAGFLIGAAIR